jgi:hypothetical protein
MENDTHLPFMKQMVGSNGTKTDNQWEITWIINGEEMGNTTI